MSRFIEFDVRTGDGPQRLDRSLANQAPDLSRTWVRRMIVEGQVTVDGAVCTKPSLKLRGGESIRAEIVDPTPIQTAPEDIPLDVLYEDEERLLARQWARG